MVFNRERKRDAQTTSGRRVRQVGAHVKCETSVTELKVAIRRSLGMQFLFLERTRHVRFLLISALATLFSFAPACGRPRVSGNEAWLLAQGGRTRATNSVNSSRNASKSLSRYKKRKPIEVMTGRATYYSDSLAGNRTASGERYNPRALTAASRELPFGTIVRVVRRDNKRRVIVRINDRGPFRNRDRILDLSRAAAEKLDMIRDGVVDIRAEILEYGKKK